VNEGVAVNALVAENATDFSGASDRTNPRVTLRFCERLTLLETLNIFVEAPWSDWLNAFEPVWFRVALKGGVAGNSAVAPNGADIEIFFVISSRVIVNPAEALNLFVALKNAVPDIATLASTLKVPLKAGDGLKRRLKVGFSD
jgi:hypothetical protein